MKSKDLKRLELVTLAQAILDLVVEPDVTDDEIDTALAYLSHYPGLLRKVRRMDKETARAWAQDIEQAMGRYYARRRD